MWCRGIRRKSLPIRTTKAAERAHSSRLPAKFGSRPLIFLDSYITSEDYEGVTAATVFQVLAEPNRLAILEVLRTGESPVGALVAELGLSQPAVSKHLRVLKEAGLVEVRVDAQRRLYRIRPEPLVELDDWLAPYRRMWHTHLDLLEEHLDRRRRT